MKKLLLVVLKTLIGVVVGFGSIVLIISLLVFTAPYVQTLPLLARGVLAFILCTPLVIGLLYRCYTFANDMFFTKDKI